MSTLRAHWSRCFALLAAFCAVMLAASAALAAGRIEWKSRTLEESEGGGSWKVEVTIYLPKPPDVAHVPMRFSFTPVMYYERTLVDGKSDPVIRKVPLENRQPLIESVDVGFLDPGSGAIQSRTRFSFKLTRGHGYEAGEYEVKVTDSRSNQTVGSPTRITFNGENEVIDRRSIVFSGEKKKKKDEEKDEAAEEPAEETKKEPTPDDDEYWAGGPTEEAEGPPPEKKKPGGCGCRVAERTELTGAAGAWLAGLAGLALIRARRSGRRALPDAGRPR